MREAKSTTDGSNQKSDRRAVVFGASGFIGSHVVEELCSAGHKVTAVLRSESSRSMLEYFGAQVRVLDYGNRSELRSVIEGQDVVFNCLATTAGGEKDKEPEVEFRLTRVLAETAATLHAGHFVQLSSIVLYGFERSGIIDESYRPSVSYRAQECSCDARRLSRKCSEIPIPGSRCFDRPVSSEAEGNGPFSRECMH
jgi:nucleoside-diphosphate-sugar epimerase